MKFHEVSIKFQAVVENISLCSEEGEPAVMVRNIRGKIHLKTTEASLSPNSG